VFNRVYSRWKFSKCTLMQMKFLIQKFKSARLGNWVVKVAHNLYWKCMDILDCWSFINVNVNSQTQHRFVKILIWAGILTFCLTLRIFPQDVIQIDTMFH